MDPETLDQLIEGAKTAGIVVGGSVTIVAAFFGSIAGIMDVAERKYALDIMYDKGMSNQKPTYFTALKSYIPCSSSYIRQSNSNLDD